MKDIKNLNIAKVVKAIEADAGESLPGLREALAEAKAGNFGATRTHEQIIARKRGRPTGSTKADAKLRTAIRLDPDVLVALKTSGSGWQTRVNDLLWADIKGGRLSTVKASH